MSDKLRSIFTTAAHAGMPSGDQHGAVAVPIYTTSIYEFPDAETADEIHNERTPGYYYGRLGNPTTEAFEKAVAELEAGGSAIAFASGMAAISGVILSMCKTGDHIIAPVSHYSTTGKLLRFIEERFGIAHTLVDSTDPDTLRSAMRSDTRMIWIESPSNPLLRVIDIDAVAAFGKSNGLITVADNTFATPFNQRPLTLGADIVIHSATKYIGGHSDLTAGVAVAGREMIETIRQSSGKLFGGNISPQVAWLALRGLKTLAIRMERHNSNAYALADMLAACTGVVKVFYPGLSSFEGHEIASRQMKGGFGGMLSFDLGTLDAAKRFVDSVRVCTLATSLGGVETLVQPSISMTNAGMSSSEKERSGIPDGLVRMSVGIECIDDLKDDVLDALKAAVANSNR